MSGSMQASLSPNVHGHASDEHPRDTQDSLNTENQKSKSSNRALMACFGVLVVIAVILAIVFASKDTTVPPPSPPGPVDNYHPLASFTVDQATQAIRILETTSPNTGGGSFLESGDGIYMAYEMEPAKSQVLEWSPNGTRLNTRMYVVLGKRKTNEVLVAIVDLTLGNVTQWRKVDTVKEGAPSVTLDELLKITPSVMNNASMVQALADRGLKPSEVQCVPLSWGGQWGAAGGFEQEELAGRRLANIRCLVISTTNPWFTPVPDLTAVMDLTTGEVLRLIDAGKAAAPVPKPDPYDDVTLARRFGGFASVNRPAATQPKNFAVNARGEVTWGAWKFHAKFHPRAGVILSMGTFRDPFSPTSENRTIFYQIHPSELFVPYMDPDHHWANRVYMDAGEYGMGTLGTTGLVKDGDCPADAHFIEGAMFVNRTVVKVEKGACVFERSTTIPGWRHFEQVGIPFSNGRPSLDLIVRYSATVGNYDYIIDFVFQEDGAITFDVTMTGIVETRAVHETRRTGAPFPYGTMCDPNSVAVYHDHFFNFRLDLDVDGQSNRFVRERVQKVRLPDDNPAGRRSTWTMVEDLVGGELDAPSNPAITTASAWNFRHSTKQTALGNPVGYRLVPGLTAVSFLDDDDPPQKRAMFSRYALWVTQFNEFEKYPGGEFVNMGPGGNGIDSWVTRNASLVDEDVVAWYTVGVHHITRQEDGPVMPRLTQTFSLIPENFFEANPSLNIPPLQ